VHPHVVDVYTGLKNENSPKNAKMTTYWKPNNEGGPVFTFSLPRGAARPRVPSSVTPLLPPVEIGINNQIFLEKPEVGILIPINWFDSCNDTFFAGMKLTLHKSQVHSYSVMQWWACSLLMSPILPAQVGCESRERLFYWWSLLRNNNMATYLPIFTLY